MRPFGLRRRHPPRHILGGVAAPLQTLPQRSQARRADKNTNHIAGQRRPNLAEPLPINIEQYILPSLKPGHHRRARRAIRAAKHRCVL
jgi:hypothetical protein